MGAGVLELPPLGREGGSDVRRRAGWERPIRFAKGVGGHVAAVEMAHQARRRGVRRLVLAHIGRPTIRAMDAGERPPFGRFGVEGAVFGPRRWRDAV